MKYKWQKKHEDHIKLYTIELFHKLFLADLQEHFISSNITHNLVFFFPSNKKRWRYLLTFLTFHTHFLIFSYQSYKLKKIKVHKLVGDV